ncbi:ATP-binding protein [Siphonobacter aquaeclarae]|uniref:Histidine kinase-, DNA gyrase B-, and HSP90-like ATPase n=1 Tax=Siphonobacter aquaeclarae TaxID=563176 RepID=A0A1G9RUW9_9BACT|nr:tetratricopeptide repeat protein [Siphonobacter aquaeclarae]SDM26295.1 Histidine kinase-, DNA gyrase B-, and HSP90-like ATPase [Siphonobacter aquaeclarae]
MKRFLLLSFMIVRTLDLGAQVPASRDSLEAFLRTHPRDTLYVQGMVNYVWMLLEQEENTRQGDSIAVQLGLLANRLNYPLGKFLSVNLRGAVAYHKDEHRKALNFFEESRRICLQYNLPKQRLQVTLNNISIMYKDLGESEKSMQYALQSIAVFEKYKLPKLSGEPYNVVGYYLKTTGQYRKALGYYEKSLSYNRKDGDPSQIAITENGMGNVYDDMGLLPEALNHYQAALKAARKANYPLLENDCLVSIGRMYEKMGKYREALDAFLLSEKTCLELGSQEALNTTLTNLVNAYQDLKLYRKAEDVLDRKMKLSVRLKEAEDIQITHQGYAQLYSEMGRFREAFVHQSRWVEMKDSLLNIEREVKLQELTTRYETEKKEQQIRLLQQDNKLKKEEADQQRLVKQGYLGGGLLLLLAGGLGAGWMLNRQKVRRLEESERMRNKIAADLHDEIGGTLSSISLLSSLMEQQIREKKTEMAAPMIRKIETDARQILESMDDIVWTVNPGNDSLARVVARLREYARPLMDARSIRLTIDAAPDLDGAGLGMEVRRSVYLIVKEALNNAAKYSGATEVSVQFLREKRLTVMIADNGKGFDSAQVTSRNGLRNMRTRATEIGGNLDIDSANGTRITLTV